MKLALSILALAALAACGGGGSGGGGGSFPTAAQTPSATAAQAAPLEATPATPAQTKTVNANCVANGYIACDLEPGTQSVNVPAGTYVTFVNKTGTYLQIDQVDAATGERQFWAEYCVYLNVFGNQVYAGSGEVGCMTKNVGEDYPSVRWGKSTGLSIAPGGVLWLNAHTEPAPEAYTYSLTVRPQASGLSSWRQPRADRVIPCDDKPQSTDWNPWQNTTGQDLHLSGVSIYAVSGTSTPNTLSDAACLFVLNADGTPKYTNCDDSLRTRGEASMPELLIAPGEFVAVQATNACASPGTWDFVAYLHVW